MSVIKGMSRAVVWSVVKTLALQFEVVGRDCTAYSVARALDISPPTARKILALMTAHNILREEKLKYRNTKKSRYFAVDGQSKEVSVQCSKILNEYWGMKWLRLL